MKVCHFALLATVISGVASEILSPSRNTENDLQGLSSHAGSRKGAQDSNFHEINSFSQTHKAHEFLAHFLSRLKSFISKKSFDALGFEQQIGELKSQFSVAVASAETASPWEIAAQSAFTRKAFQTMTDSIVELTFYNVSDAIGHRWVYKVIELNVRLLGLLDQYGNLDVTIKNVGSGVLCFWRKTLSWNERFRKSNGVSPEMTQDFERHITEAEKTIRRLVHQLPKEEHGWC